MNTGGEVAKRIRRSLLAALPRELAAPPPLPRDGLVRATIGNLRSTTKETTTTSIDRARTGTRTSFSVGEMKVK